MKRIEATSPEAQSANIVAGHIDQLKTLFPELITEGAGGVSVNVDVLKALVGDKTVSDSDEKYGLNWHGKRRARQLALTPSTGTLRPCPDESVDWDSTQNLMIEGDNLEVLKLMQKSYAGKVKLIYIDPPYNTGKDFVYPDNFQDNIKNYLELTGQVEGGKKISSNTEASGRFHTDWLNMIYPRLRLARNLLNDNGAIFLTIGDHEVARLRIILDEVFGEENFIANIVWQKKQSPQNDAINLSDMHDHVLVYAKRAKQNRFDSEGWSRNKVTREAAQEARYENKDNDHRGPWTSADLTCNKTSDERPNLFYALKNPITGADVWPNRTRVWAYEKAAINELTASGKLWWGRDGSNMPRLKIFRTDVDDGVVPSTWWIREFAGDNQDARRELRSLFPEGDVFDTPKPVQLIKRMLEIGTNTSGQDVVLDFFCGSATTGHAVFDMNAQDQGDRRFILVQLPEPLELSADPKFSTISQVSMERLRRSTIKISAVNAQSTVDTGQLTLEVSPKPSVKPLDLGFRVFKLDNSNIRAWNPDRDNLAQTLLDHEEHILEGRTEADIVYELLLKLGLDLCVPLESRPIAGKTVGAIGGGVLMTCLAEKIANGDVEGLAQGIVDWHKQLAPAGDTTCVFRDSAFESDVAKTNLAAILEQYGIQNVRSL